VSTTETIGFDPAARRRSWKLIQRLRSLGKTILLTTHYMEEVQRLADRVVVIGSGRVIATGTPDDLARERPTVISFRVPAPGSRGRQREPDVRPATG